MECSQYGQIHVAIFVPFRFDGPSNGIAGYRMSLLPYLVCFLAGVFLGVVVTEALAADSSRSRAQVDVETPASVAAVSSSKRSGSVSRITNRLNLATSEIGFLPMMKLLS